MNKQAKDTELELIKNALLSIKPAGPEGFEGLLRIILTKMTGIPFRLAKSGLQGGIDGHSASNADPVSFEAKLYSGKIDRKDVLVKIPDFARQENAADRLWVLGATTEVGSQTISSLEIDADKNSISTLVLDWTATPLPLLAVAVVKAGEDAIDFILENFDPKSNQSKPNKLLLSNAFAAALKRSEFEALYQGIVDNLNISKLGLARSIALNNIWKTEVFGAKRLARERLGQSLAVAEKSALPSLRTSLRNQIRELISKKESSVLVGGEGQGKSWLAAQVCLDHKGLALFASAERLENVEAKDLDDFIVGLCIEQTGDISSEAIRQRWYHRFNAWEMSPPNISILLIVDGINQRQSLRWDQLLSSLQDRLQALGGIILVTVRPQCWHKEVAPGILFKPKLIDIPEWTDSERDKLLKHHGVELDWLDTDTLETLKNPRLLGIAVATLPIKQSTSWIGLTTDRLLMEHLRASQRENFEGEPLRELTKRLSSHASAVIEKIRKGSNEPPQNFVSDSTAVIETRFFQTLDGPGEIYELLADGLTLALGYALVDQLWQAQRAGRDLPQHISQLTDPIEAMDRTVDVVFSSLLVCALDTERFHLSIFESLLDAFSNLQNLNDQRFEEFTEIIRHAPKGLFNVLSSMCLERGKRINHNWFAQAAINLAKEDEVWDVAKDSIHNWLRSYNKNAVGQSNRYPKGNDKEDEKRLKETQKRIDDVLSNLSTFEVTLLTQMTEVQGDTDRLYDLALKLLAGRPLAEFSDSFVALGLGFALDRGIHSARKAFQQLTTFNKVDRDASAEAFKTAIRPLQNSESSSAGRWTIVRMLHATGLEDATIEAEEIAKELRKDWHQFETPSPKEWRQVNVADPSATPPTDLESGLQKFEQIDCNQLLKTMGCGSEDHTFEEFVPTACRFAPQSAAEKATAILNGLLTRTGLPLRQLVLNGYEFEPLMSRELAIKLLARLPTFEFAGALVKNDTEILRMFIFNFIVSELNPKEQLFSLASSHIGSDYLLDVIPKLKTQEVAPIIVALDNAIASKDDQAAYGALAAALYGKVKITKRLEALTILCCGASLSKLRAICFELAIQHDLKSVRDAHVKGQWSATDIAEKTFESWYGSLLLVEASAKGEITEKELLSRISSKTWFVAAEKIGGELANSLAKRFLVQIKNSVGDTRKVTVPSSDLVLSANDRSPYPYLSINDSERATERFPKEKSISEALGDGEKFEDRQARLREISDAFFKSIKDSDARILVQWIDITDLQLLCDADPTLLQSIDTVLEQSSDVQFVWYENLALAAAKLLSEEAPDRAVSLFKRAEVTNGFVVYALGDGLTMEHSAIWSSKSSETIQAFWRQRIFGTTNNAELAREVLAAERFGASTFLIELTKELASSESTLDQAYAVTIAGYCTNSLNLRSVIEPYLEQRGLTGDAARNAMKSHNSALWATKWINDMWDARSQEEFWRCLIIAKTTMDARISPYAKRGTKWSQFEPLVQRVRKSAIKEQNKSREKQFLGEEKPDPIFLK